jgi:hypothetical protein
VAWLVTIVAIVPRVWFAVDQHPPGLFIGADMAMYAERAEHLRKDALGPADTMTPPGFPLLLALLQVVSPRGWADLLAWAHALLGAATCGLVYLIGRRVSASPAVALAASLVAALYVPLIFYGGFVLSETLFAFAVTLSAWLVLRAADVPSWRRCAAAGLCMGAAAVVHANFAAGLALLFVFDRRIAVRVALCALLPIALACAFASHLVGHLVGISTNGGVNFFLAHSDWRSACFPASDAIQCIVPRPNALREGPVYVSPGEAWNDHAFYMLGLKSIVSHPLRLLVDGRNVTSGLGLTSLDYYPGWMAHPTLLHAFSRSFFWVALLPAAIRAAMLARRGALLESKARFWLWLLVGQAIAILYLYLGDPRIRVPFDPLCLVLAADAWTAFAQWVFYALQGREASAVDPSGVMPD